MEGSVAGSELKDQPVVRRTGFWRRTRRRRFLNYLQRKNLEGYRAVIKELGLRR
jgi:ribosomal protein S15P/S13E